MGNAGTQGRHSGYVERLLPTLHHTTPEDVIYFSGVQLWIAIQQPLNQRRADFISTAIPEGTIFRAAHGGSRAINNHRVSWFQAHKISPVNLWSGDQP